MSADQWIAVLLGAPAAVAIIVAPVVALMRRLGAIEDKIVGIEAQHRNNGGSTMKDAIERIDRNVGRIDQKVDQHLLTHAAPAIVVQQAPPVPPQQ